MTETIVLPGDWYWKLACLLDSGHHKHQSPGRAGWKDRIGDRTAQLETKQIDNGWCEPKRKDAFMLCFFSN